MGNGAGEVVMDPVVGGSMDARVAATRRFNRFWTQRIGVLHEGFLGGPFSLTETRVLYELAHHDGIAAVELGRGLGLDSGYLSRLLRGFDRAGLISRAVDVADARRVTLRLTDTGRAAFAPLTARSDAQAAELLAGLPEAGARAVVAAMRQIEVALAATPADGWLMRPLRPGDMGWVISRHGALYAEQYGWDVRFEALVAEIGAGVIRNFDPAREAGWIAERDGVPVGSVFLLRSAEAADIAKLRLLIVEPAARGLGIGARLVAECERFARDHGYRRITLWTNSVLLAARRIYEAQGYRLVASDPYHDFGHDLVGENWELDLV
jgi:DNA-binding MarR family transcriptional regulator/GNAT superfamily N-acetyltransferase